MRTLAIALVLLVGFSCAYLATSAAQDSGSASSAAKAAETSRFVIVPLVAIRPGETQELLLSTWCTVGVTRGGGFSVAEMRDGKAHFESPTLKGNRKFRERGITVTVPDFAEGVAFAATKEFEALKKHNVAPFRVTIEASSDAKPGEFFEMHLLDATCSGHCKTDFRVLVLEPE